MTTQQYAYLANKHPRAGHDWNSVEDELMLVHMQARWSLTETVLAHGRTEGAIMARAHKIMGVYGFHDWPTLCKIARGEIYVKGKDMPTPPFDNLCKLPYFWMVSGGGPTGYRHLSEHAAIVEAKRLAAANPGQDFYVMKASHKVSANVVTVTEL